MTPLEAVAYEKEHKCQLNDPPGPSTFDPTRNNEISKVFVLIFFSLLITNYFRLY